LTSSITKGNIS